MRVIDVIVITNVIIDLNCGGCPILVLIFGDSGLTDPGSKDRRIQIMRNCKDLHKSILLADFRNPHQCTLYTNSRYHLN